MDDNITTQPASISSQANTSDLTVKSVFDVDNTDQGLAAANFAEYAAEQDAEELDALRKDIAFTEKMLGIQDE